MIRTIYYAPDNTLHKDLKPDEIVQALNEPRGLLWVSLERPTLDETNQILTDIFHFHPLAIEDCLSEGYQTPKVDDYGSYIFLIVHAIQKTDGFKDFDTQELNIFLGENYLVSYYYEGEFPAILNTWNMLARDERLHSNGADFLCHAILDRMVDDYFPVLDQLEDEIDAIEDILLEKPQPKNMQTLLSLKHTILTMRRFIFPQREIINRLTRDEFPMIDRQSQIYFRDIYDHLVRVQDWIENMRDMVSSCLDIYLNSTSLRLNEVMKALTVVSTIFLPLTFLAGVYGMNFKHMPELNWVIGYPLVWVVFVLIVFGMLRFFKKKGWF